MTPGEDEVGAAPDTQQGPRADEALLEVWRTLAGIPDPCQQACGYDLGIVDLGIVNGVTALDGVVTVSLTFTESLCTFGFRIIADIEDRLARLPGVREVEVTIEAFPPWDPSRMTDRARDVHAARRARFGPRAGGAVPDVVVGLSSIKRGTEHG